MQEQYSIHKNIVNYIKSRGYVSGLKDPEDFKITMQVLNYIDFIATGREKKIHIFQMDNSVSKLPDTIYSKTEKNVPVIVVGKYFISRHTEVKEYGKRRIPITYLNNKLFISDIKNHYMVPPHSICTDEEMKKVMADNSIISIDQFPKIKYTDPQVVLLDGKHGQLVKIIRNTPTGKIPYYRIIQ